MPRTRAGSILQTSRPGKGDRSQIPCRHPFVYRLAAPVGAPVGYLTASTRQRPLAIQRCPWVCFSARDRRPRRVLSGEGPPQRSRHHQLWSPRPLITSTSSTHRRRSRPAFSFSTLPPPLLGPMKPAPLPVYILLLTHTNTPHQRGSLHHTVSHGGRIGRQGAG